MVRISASILSFYFESEARDEPRTVMVNRINEAIEKKKNNFDILHFDIEDGKFVDQKSFIPSDIRKIKCDKKREAHLMVVNYDEYIKEYFPFAEMFIIHNEVMKSSFPKTIEFLKKNKKFIGISINPETSIDEIKFLDKVDLILVMSVEPGLPGQKFIEPALRKIKKLAELRKKNKYKYTIEVDGGINYDIAKECEKAGADIVVMGSAMFKG